MKQDATAMREEKIRRMRVEKECENRLKEIALMEVIGLIGFVNLQERREKGCVVDDEMEREKWLLALQSCARKALNDLHMIPQEMEILRYMESMRSAGKDLHQEVVQDE